jgi:hypothetical protein
MLKRITKNLCFSEEIATCDEQDEGIMILNEVCE